MVSPRHNYTTTSYWDALWTGYATYLHMVRKLEVHLEANGIDCFSELTEQGGHHPVFYEADASKRSGWLDGPTSMPMPLTVYLYKTLSRADPSTGGLRSRVLRLEFTGVRNMAGTLLIEGNGEVAVTEHDIVVRAHAMIQAELKAQCRAP